MGDSGQAAQSPTVPAADAFIQKTQQHQHTQQLYQQLLDTLGEDHLTVVSLKAGLDKSANQTSVQKGLTCTKQFQDSRCAISRELKNLHSQEETLDALYEKEMQDLKEKTKLLEENFKKEKEKIHKVIEELEKRDRQ
eukprot:8384829-Karenia_brevis.AAC.1